MPALLTFFIILASGLILSEIFKRLHLPYVTALIIAGILIGPSALNLIQIDDTVLFLGSVGVVFLMFIAGSEIKSDFIRRTRKDIYVITIFNSFIPFLTGFLIGVYFGFGIFQSLILGTIFISSSIAVIIPALESTNLIKKRIGKHIISLTVFQDIGSLILLALFLQAFRQTTPIPLILYVPTIIFFIILLKIVVPKLQKIYTSHKKGKDLFESYLRFIFVVLLATVLLFEFMGMHAIIAGFIIGIILGDAIKDKIERKIRTVSYGIFIPIFFLVLGMQTDFSVFTSSTAIKITLVIVLGSLISKIFSGWLAGKLLSFSNRESLLIGVATTPKLSASLAAAFAALELGLLTKELITSLVILAIVTTLITPILVKAVASRKTFV